MAGAKNIAEDQDGWSYSKELIVEQQPRVILLNKGMKELFLSLPVYRDLDASLGGRVYEINEDALVRQGPRQIEALEELHKIVELNLDDNKRLKHVKEA